MPQTHRSVAFSGKKKKEQMKARKARKVFVKVPQQQQQEDRSWPDVDVRDPGLDVTQEPQGSQAEGVNYMEEVESIGNQPHNTRDSNVNRYNLKFHKETQEEIRRGKAVHHMEVTLVPETEMEASTDKFYPENLSYPVRPEWNKNMSKAALDASENKYFRLFCDKLDREFARAELSLYELNLETWRQLWRVTEMSDVLLIIVDARFPVAQFPPYLYHHLAEKENRGIILILNKCDLLPPEVIVAWEHYFQRIFRKLLVVPFSSFESRVHPRGRLRMSAESSLRLVEACEQLVGDSVDLSQWRSKIEEEQDLDVDGKVETTEGTWKEEASSTLPEVHQRFKDGVLTLGTIGFPNVGKSSLINALMGKKVVSVSKTPGHTKHFQTIFLTKNVKLCDCPGLVFPSTVEKPLQVVMGSYPISQVRDPISVVRYIATVLDLPSVLGLASVKQLSDSPRRGNKWTAYQICETWATKRGYFIRKRGGANVFRAANELLRFCLNGQKSLILYLRPPGYSKEKVNLKCDPRVEDIKLIQGSVTKKEDLTEEDNEGSGSDEEESDGDTEEEQDNEEEEKLPLLNVCNKFSLLLDDD